MEGEAFSELPLSAYDRSYKKNLIVLNLLLVNFIIQARLTLIRGEETRRQHHTQTLSHTITSPIYSKSLLFFLKNHLFSPKWPMPSLPCFYY